MLAPGTIPAGRRPCPFSPCVRVRVPLPGLTVPAGHRKNWPRLSQPSMNDGETRMTQAVATDALALERLYHWERSAPDRVVLTQPLGGGNVKDFTWREVLDETRRMAAHLQGHGFEPGARIGILAKNAAHWLMADFAI